LVKVGEKDEKIGVIGPKIYFYDEPNIIWSTGSQKYYGNIDNKKNNISEEVKWVMGCAFLIKANLIKNVGLLDPRYFLYGEEIDYCIRVKKAKYKLFYVANSKIWHKAPLQKQIHSKPYQVYYECRNSILLRRKNYSGIKFFISILRYLLLTMPYYILTLLKDKKFILALSAIKGLKDGLFGLHGENKQIKLSGKRA